MKLSSNIFQPFNISLTFTVFINQIYFTVLNRKEEEDSSEIFSTAVSHILFNHLWELSQSAPTWNSLYSASSLVQSLCNVWCPPVRKVDVSGDFWVSECHASCLLRALPRANLHLNQTVSSQLCVLHVRENTTDNISSLRSLTVIRRSWVKTACATLKTLFHFWGTAALWLELF